MVTNLKEPIYRKIKEHVTHQGIGGKEIRIEKAMLYDDVWKHGGIGAQLFIDRRQDLLKLGLVTDKEIDEIRQGKYTVEEFNDKWDKFFNTFQIYYGHVGNLGYFVAEDELEDDKNASKD